MQPAFFSLILIAVHVSLPVDCRPKLQDPEQLRQHQEGSLSSGAHADTSTGTGRFHLELKRSMRHVIYRDFLVIFPVRRENFVSIFDLRRKRFLCMDSNGKLFHSRQKDREDCLFQRILLDLANHHDVFYSTSGNLLLKLVGNELRASHWEPPEPSPALTKRSPSIRRQRRSEDVNPSDPLRSGSHPSHTGKDPKDADHGQPEQDRAGAVSKETITSCDDPLRVLQSKGAVSPVKANIADRADQD